MTGAQFGRLLSDFTFDFFYKGILMIIAWVFAATIGIFMSRYMKPVTADKKIHGKQAWFPVSPIDIN